MVVRSELGAVCLLVCDLLGMSRGFSAPIRDAVAARPGSRPGRGAHVVHPHPRRTEHARGQRPPGLGDAGGLSRPARRALRRGARGRGGQPRPAPSCGWVDGRCPTGCRSTGEASRTTRRSPCSMSSGSTARGSERSPTSPSIPSRSGPSVSRSRATGSGRSARRSSDAPAARPCCSRARSVTSIRITSIARTTTVARTASRKRRSSAATSPRSSTTRSVTRRPSTSTASASPATEPST